MTTWLWIIGITALAWPLILVKTLERHTSRHFHGAMEQLGVVINTNSQNFEKHLFEMSRIVSEMSRIVEHQDALIAVLWAKSYGYFAEDGCVREKSKEAWGVRPPWYLCSDPHSFTEFDKLVREVDYPWGRPSWLRRGE